MKIRGKRTPQAAPAPRGGTTGAAIGLNGNAGAGVLFLPASEMAARVRGFDWSATPLGPIEAWPRSLKTAVGICLSSRFPMFVWWGPGLINIYNDAYAPVLGKRHPEALGRPARAIWGEIWPVLGPQADAVMLRAESTWNDRVPLQMERNGYPETTYFTWSYSPIPEESGAVGGLFCACTEETARVVAEGQRDRLSEELTETQARLGSTLSAAELGTWTWDIRADRVVADTNLARLFSVPAEEARGAPIGRYTHSIHPDDRSRVEKAIADALSSRETYETEYRIVQGGDAVRWVLARGRVERDARGEATSLPGVILDITDRVLAERARRELSATLERQALVFDTTLSSITDFAYILDRESRFRYANKALLDLWGLTLAEAVGKDFFDLKYPADLAARLHGHVEQVFRTGKRLSDETPYTSPAGVEGHYEYIFSPVFAADGTVEVIAGSTRDITERKRADAALRESERRMGEVFESAPAFMAVLRGPDLVYEKVNRAYIQLVGDRGGLVGRPLLEAIPEVADQPFPAILKRVMATGEAYPGKGVRLVLRRTEHGPLEERWVDFVYQPLREPDGAVSGVLAHGVDLTERVTAEAELLRHREHLQELVEQKTAALAASTAVMHAAERLASLGTLAAGLGHDIANLTLPIRARLAGIGASCTTDEARTDVAAISSALDHLTTLSAGMRLMAMDPEREGVSSPASDLAAWRDETTPILRAALPAHVRLECSFEPGIGVGIPRHRLAQAVFNLVQNAGEAMAGQAAGMVRVTAASSPALDGPPRVRLTVADDGPGMTPAVLARCFEPYFSTKGRAISTGMGLGMVKGIIESAGGAVAVESAPGSGTVFTLDLPAPAPAPPDHPHAKGTAPRNAAVTIGHDRTAALACMFLQQLGFMCARHPGPQAPETVLWVLESPGGEVIRAYLDQNPRCRVVVLGDAGTAGRGGHGAGGQPFDGGRVTILPASPSPGALRDALTAAGHAAGVAPAEE